jgi:AraC-like DNA-binding protein
MRRTFIASRSSTGIKDISKNPFPAKAVITRRVETQAGSVLNQKVISRSALEFRSEWQRTPLVVSSMSYSEIAPHPDLSPFVECYWAIQDSKCEDERTNIVYPDGCNDLIWNIGQERPCTLVGAMLAAIEVPQATHHNLIGIRFRPGALYPFLQIPMHEWTDQMAPLSEVKKSHPLINLGSNPTLSRIEETLRRLATDVPYRSNDVLYAIQQLEKRGHCHTVDSIAKELRMSSRTLERKFKIQTGLLPKAMIRILRFHHAKHLLENGASVLTVLEDCGFYDYSHLVKEVRAIGGVSVGFLQDLSRLNH